MIIRDCEITKSRALFLAELQKLPEEQVGDFGISLELDGALMHLLVNNVAQGSEAKSLLRSIESKPGLEAWHRFWKDAMPKGRAQETVEKGLLMKPDRASNYKTFKSMLLFWGTALADCNKLDPKGLQEDPQTP